MASNASYCVTVRRLACLAVLVPLGCAAGEPARSAPGTGKSAPTLLFDGRSLGDFEPTVFGGEGPVTVADGALVLGIGAPLTGVTWRGEALPRAGYELAFTATRRAGTDFFCGLTFPVGDSHASLILGGWGGAVTGISSIDGYDASANETTTYIHYANGRPYRVRLRVGPRAERIRAWIDGEQVVDADVAGREVSLRPEVLPSSPLGIASYATEAVIGPIELRRVDGAGAGPDGG